MPPPLTVTDVRSIQWPIHFIGHMCKWLPLPSPSVDRWKACPVHSDSCLFRPLPWEVPWLGKPSLWAAQGPLRSKRRGPIGKCRTRATQHLSLRPSRPASQAAGARGRAASLWGPEKLRACSAVHPHPFEFQIHTARFSAVLPQRHDPVPGPGAQADGAG